MIGVEEDSADPYLPYDGGGDTIPLHELSGRGTSLSDRPRTETLIADNRYTCISLYARASCVLSECVGARLLTGDSFSHALIGVCLLLHQWERVCCNALIITCCICNRCKNAHNATVHSSLTLMHAVCCFLCALSELKCDFFIYMIPCDMRVFCACVCVCC